MSEPDWRDKSASKQWLEERYVGSAGAGSPLLQHCMVKGRNTHRLEDHLSRYELYRWLVVNKTSGAFHYGPQSVDFIFYPEYGTPESPAKSQVHSPKPERATKLRETAGRTARKETQDANSGATVQKSSSSKQQRSSHSIKRPKRSEPDAKPTSKSRLRTLRPRRKHRRSRTSRIPQVLHPYRA